MKNYASEMQQKRKRKNNPGKSDFKRNWRYARQLLAGNKSGHMQKLRISQPLMEGFLQRWIMKEAGWVRSLS